MRIFLISFLSVLFFCTSPVSGEYYRYLDENGVVCFTDDPTQIPDEKREKSDIYKDAPRETKDVFNDQVKKKTKTPEPPQDESGNFQELRQLNNELETEYFVLKSERELLLQQGNEKMKEAEAAVYNKKVSDLNKRAIAYKERKKNYMKRMRAYYKSTE